MNFAQAIQSVLSKYAVFSGRAIRSEYWFFALFALLLSIAASIMDTLILGGGMGDTGVFEMILGLALFLPNIAVTIRRLHDLERSGWWILINLIPIVGWIIFLIWMCTKGTDGPNNFGPDYFDGPYPTDNNLTHQSSIPTIRRDK